MSDERYFDHSSDGQEVRQEDVDSLAENGAFAGDRLLWELLRTLPGTATPARGILPAGHSDWSAYGALTSTATVQGNTADAKVRVLPFRAIIGSVTALAAPYTDNLRAIKSAYVIGASFYTEATIGPNASGNPRWDLVYVTVTPDVAETNENVLVKSPTTPFAVTPTALNTYRKTTAVISVAPGTAAAVPVFPVTPADGAGSYVIRLAYVYVPDGFGAASTVLRENIREVAPVLSLHSSMGVANTKPANQANFVSTDGATLGSVFTAQGRISAGGYAPSAYLPANMVGGEKRIILIQLELAPASHATDDIVDDSVDWRFRYFSWKFYVKAGATAGDSFASGRESTGIALVPSAALAASSGQQTWGFGQSFVNDQAAVSLPAAGTPGGTALYVSGGDLSDLTAGKAIILWVDATTGALKVSFTAGTTGQIYIEIEATAPYSNYGTV